MKVAKRCGITNIIDNKTKRKSIGVGTMTDVGSIHFMIGKFGSFSLPFLLDVVEDLSVDMLLGLDIMQLYNITIDVPKNGLDISSNGLNGLVKGGDI